MFVEVMSQLRFEKSPARATLEIPFTAQSVSLIEIGFVVNQSAWSPVCCGSGLSALV